MLYKYNHFHFKKSIYFANIGNIALHKDNLITTKDSVFIVKPLLLRTSYLHTLK